MTDIVLLGGVVLFATASLVFANTARDRTQKALASISPRPGSPLDEAERILSRRYARGQITLDEYRRMSVLLRR